MAPYGTLWVVPCFSDYVSNGHSHFESSRWESNRQHFHAPLLTSLSGVLQIRFALGGIDTATSNRVHSSRILNIFITLYYSQYQVSCKSTLALAKSTQLPRIESLRVKSLTYSCPGVTLLKFLSNRLCFRSNQYIQLPQIESI